MDSGDVVTSMRWILVLALAFMVGCAAGRPIDGGTRTDTGVRMDGGPGDCPGSQTRCGLSCVDTASDMNHCSECGFACMAGQACVSGLCTTPGCGEGETNCTGGCVDTRFDVSNCGGCGVECADGEECLLSACRAPCMAPTSTRCGTDCVSLTRDSSNCGRCGTACTAPDICDIGVCQSPCVATPATPDFCTDTCVDVLADLQHCGMCDNACPMGDLCEAGACVLDCGTMDRCGRACLDLLTDEANCGTCGNTCASDEVCVDGACSDAVVDCGGYLYPERAIVASTSCTGGFTGCTGAREFLVVGCHTLNPGDLCPPGYDVASLMLIGQWAEAANITRYVSGTRVCAWTNGTTAVSACGGTAVNSPYCWERGTGCRAGCTTNCCDPSGGACSSSASLPVPLLCVLTP